MRGKNKSTAGYWWNNDKDRKQDEKNKNARKDRDWGNEQRLISGKNV